MMAGTPNEDQDLQVKQPKEKLLQGVYTFKLISVVWICLCGVCTYEYGCPQCNILLELESQTVINHRILVIGAKLGSSGATPHC